jgi:hypothetical protein
MLRGAKGAAGGCATGGCRTGRSGAWPEGCPDASGGRNGAARAMGGGGASACASRAGACGASTVSCLGAGRGVSADDAVSTACSGAVSTSEVCERDAVRFDPFDSSVRRRFTSTATGSSIELEWVFFSTTPNSGSISRITFGLTSSSRASSLIRIFTILCAPPSNSDTGVVRLNPAPYQEPPHQRESPQCLS